MTWTRTTRTARRRLWLLLAIPLLAGVLAAVPTTRAQSPVDIWTGQTSQGQRFMMVVEGGTVTALNVGVHIKTHTCSSYYTAVHHGNLGRVGYNRFSVFVENDEEGLILDGTLGDTASGTLLFVSKPALRSVCSGSVQATWNARWSQQFVPQPVPGLPNTGVAGEVQP